jgi:hypothetical protein
MDAGRVECVKIGQFEARSFAGLKLALPGGFSFRPAGKSARQNRLFDAMLRQHLERNLRVFRPTGLLI